jgi:hypothetical protein
VPFLSSQPFAYRFTLAWVENIISAVVAFHRLQISLNAQTLGTESFFYANGSSLTGQAGGGGWLGQSLSLTGINSGSFSVHLPSPLGQTYRIKRLDQLSPAAWQVVNNNISGSGALIQIAARTTTNSQRFYRTVILTP